MTKLEITEDTSSGKEREEIHTLLDIEEIQDAINFWERSKQNPGGRTNRVQLTADAIENEIEEGTKTRALEEYYRFKDQYSKASVSRLYQELENRGIEIQSLDEDLHQKARKHLEKHH
jgi:superfamily II DNA/RNA helicase